MRVIILPAVPPTIPANGLGGISKVDKVGTGQFVEDGLFCGLVIDGSIVAANGARYFLFHKINIFD